MPKARIRTGSATPIRVQLSHLLREEISAGKHATGSRIPSERDLAERYGISRTSVRESITELIEAGVLFRAAGKGTFVAERPAPAPVVKAVEGVCFAISRNVLRFVQAGYDRILAGVESACADAGVSLYFQSVPEDGESVEGKWGRGGGTPAGCVVVGGMNPRVLDWFRDNSIPYVLVDLLFAESVPVPVTVRLDYAAGTKAAMEHLFSLGHTRIGFIGFAGSERYKAYWQALEQCGLSYNARHVEFISPVSLQPSVFAGYGAMQRLIAAGDLPTALVVVNDFVAHGAIEQLKIAGISVPGDISIVGFDDLDCRTDPPLTTVRVDLHKTGRFAAELLFRAVRDGHRAKETYAVPVDLVVRCSTAPPKVAPPRALGHLIR